MIGSKKSIYYLMVFGSICSILSYVGFSGSDDSVRSELVTPTLQHQTTENRNQRGDITVALFADVQESELESYPNNQVVDKAAPTNNVVIGDGNVVGDNNSQNVSGKNNVYINCNTQNGDVNCNNTPKTINGNGNFISNDSFKNVQGPVNINFR